MKKTALRAQVLGMLTTESVNLAMLYRRCGQSRQAVLQALRLGAGCGLVRLARERHPSEERAAHYTAAITPAGQDWLRAPSEEPAPEPDQPQKSRRPQAAKYATVDLGVDGANALLRQSW